MPVVYVIGDLAGARESPIYAILEMGEKITAIELRRAEGETVAQAVVDAGAVRFRPMLLTAAAVMVGAGVILFDPIFQGLAISLIAGEVASLFLSRMAVPVLYALKHRRDDARRPA